MRLRRCRRARSQPRQEATAPGALGHRVTEQGNTIDVALLRGFLKRALEDDAEALQSCISEITDAARREDWQAVADALIAEARELDGEV